MINKRKAQTMHLPFGFIFSLILIVIFIVIAFYAISYFIGIQKCGAIGSFTSEFREKVSDIWKEDAAKTSFSQNMPNVIEYVCFANLSIDKDLTGLNSQERQIASQLWNEIYIHRRKNANMFLIPLKKACDFEFLFIEKLDISGTNPKCFKNINGKISIPLIKNFGEAFVRLGE